jgi:hypothetical protein
MSKKISLEEVEKRIFWEHSGNIKIYDYKSMNSHAKFQCLICGYFWYTDPGLIVYLKTGCPNCSLKRRSEKKKLKTDEVKEYIESCGHKWIDGNYEKNTSKLKILFKCGHIGIITFASIRSGSGCNVCAQKKIHDNKIIPKEEIIKRIESYGFSFIEFPEGYKNRKSKITYKCNLGHITTRKYSSFYLHPNCKICMEEYISLIHRNTLDKIILILKEKNCSLIFCGEYKNRSSKINILCACGHEEIISLENFIGRTDNVCKKCFTKLKRGRESFAWKNGMTPIYIHLRKLINDWYKQSLENNNYLCEITNNSAQTVHHLYSFKNIVLETFDLLKMEIKGKLINYSSDELKQIEEQFLKIHNSYPYGIPLTKKTHQLFHKIYSTTNFTPEDFYDFKQKIVSGEITI